MTRWWQFQDADRRQVCDALVALEPLPERELAAKMRHGQKTHAKVKSLEEWRRRYDAREQTA